MAIFCNSGMGNVKLTCGVRVGMRSVGLWMAATLAAVAGSFSLGATEAAAATCTAGTESDFNGDGIRDVEIADPEATLNGITHAGLVRVVLGGGKGVSELLQGGGAEAGDKFGYLLTSADMNQDGCTDLVVGAPYEDVLVGGVNTADAGQIHIFNGWPTGIGATIESYTQSGIDTGSNASEAGDLFGFALSAGATAGSVPHLLVGVSGEGGSGLSDIGIVHYRRGAVNRGIGQNSAGVPGEAAANDRFGSSLTSTDRMFAVGAPGEAVGNQTFAGNVTLFQDKQNADLVPTALAEIDEDQAPLVSGTAESDDRFGTALDMVAYRPVGATGNHALLAIGTPSENVATVADAGAVTVLDVVYEGGVTELNLIDRMSPDVEGEPVVSDFFGQRVTLADTSPTATSTAATMKLAVSVPNHDIGAAEQAGAVQVFPGIGAPGAGDRNLTRGDGLVPGAAGSREFAGMGLHSNSAVLYLGVPNSKGTDAPRGIVYSLPWTVIDGGAGTVTTFRPGADGLPDAGIAFGSSIR
ncbi:FG-GAP repeat protein [Streptomyces atratus]|uniref:FG-GAP repeat protein n=1 Tax=Streptomyces atratus TaxID=1893 RepID=UPI0036927CA9